MTKENKVNENKNRMKYMHGSDCATWLTTRRQIRRLWRGIDWADLGPRINKFWGKREGSKRWVLGLILRGRLRFETILEDVR
jgi:hypothetical protein